MLALGGLAGLAQAQTQPQTIERVEVTGSRIRSIDIETAQPVQTVTQEQIQKSGLVTVGDIINRMSAAGSPDFSKGSVLTSNREQGGQYINLRNLGSERLLVLVNGKRWTQSVGGYTDMSTVPSALIDRIEVLKDGASSIYGSDAIAGVVNIILKKTLNGGIASAYYGANEKGDGKTEDYNFAYGGGDDKASLMFAFTYSKQGTVWAKDRNITSTSYGPGTEGAGYGTAPWGRICAVSASGGCGGLLGNANGQILNHTGGPLGDGTGSDSRNIANYHAYRGAQADTFNSSSQMMFNSPTELKSIFTKGSLELPANLRFTTTAMYAERDSSRQIAGYPLTSTSQNAYRVYIDKDSYYNPLGSSVLGAGNGQDLFFARRTIDRPRITANNNKTLHIDGALEGEFQVASMPWNWSVSYNFSKVEGTVTSTGNLNLLNLKKALGPSFRNAAGQIQCGTAANPIALTDCVPFDILGGPSAATNSALDYVMSTGQGTYGSTIKNANADISGEIFKLPYGAVGLAAGLEKRKVEGFDRPGQFEQSGYSTDLAAKTTEGKYDVSEAYIELNIPLLKGLPAAELLSINLASRYSDYSNFGDTTNSKASFMWKPIKDLLARGTWAEGFRAPNLADTFGGGSQTFDSYIDPCDTRYGAAWATPAGQARCRAAGVFDGYRQVNQAGNQVGAGGAQGTVAFSSGAGNEFLKPETATTKTLGFVYSPSFVPGLTTSLDWYKINIKNRITAVSAVYVMGQCYTQGVSEFCSSIKRDPVTGMITALSRGNANLGELETKGIDFNIAYQLPKTQYGLFGARMESSYVDSYKIKSTNDGTWQEYAGEYPIYRFKANFSIDWSLGNWSATLASRYYGKIKAQCWDSTDPEFSCTNPGQSASWGTDVDKKKGLWYSDLSIGYKTPWKGHILVGANNVFNKKPRVVLDANYAIGSAPGSGNSSSSSVDPDLPIDRFFFVRYNQSF
ncbi:MAG TPA: TonB-dependent receptor [Roseateles sp.]|nr:TonB-dependent receptor [Roseateles sp.]